MSTNQGRALIPSSRLKWGEGLQKKRTNDALRSKRQLESFIDTTSHEMRNPLSVSLHLTGHIKCQYSWSHPSVQVFLADRPRLSFNVRTASSNHTVKRSIQAKRWPKLAVNSSKMESKPLKRLRNAVNT